MFPSVALLLLGMLAAGALTVLLVDASQWERRAGDNLLRARYWQHEYGEIVAMRERLALVQQVAEGGVGLGTGTVQAAHRAIAAIPFTILEAIPATRDTTRVVRTIHDAIADTVYWSIGSVNRLVGHGMRKGLDAASPPPAPPRDPAAKE